MKKNGEKGNGVKGNGYPILIKKEQIADCVDALGKEIMEQFAGKQLTVVGILNGAIMFLVDLLKKINGSSFDKGPTHTRMLLVTPQSYRGQEKRDMSINLNIRVDMVKDCDILIVEDIIDSGETMHYVVGLLKAFGARSITIASLLIKQGKQKPEYPLDRKRLLVGFEIPDVFVVGYGLDEQDECRDLPDIRISPKQSNGKLVDLNQLKSQVVEKYKPNSSDTEASGGREPPVSS